MQPLKASRLHDPAPSRVKYKLERLWLTPLYRALIRTGLPVLLVGVSILTYLNDADVQVKIHKHMDMTRTAIEQRPEFMVKEIRITGATERVEKHMAQVMDISFPLSSFQLDLVQLKAVFEGIPAIENASLMLGAKGVLEVGIVERAPAVVWRGDEGLMLLDAQGQSAGFIEARHMRGDLPLISGDGITDKITEALNIYRTLAPISGRVRGLLRVGARRWDVVLDRDQVLQLPEDAPIPALERILALHRVQDILNRDVSVVDIRDGRKPMLRLSSPALEEMKKLRLIAREEES